MLKGISPILPPELLKILMEMGHGDRIVIGDGNFPAANYAQRLVRCDGHGVPALLEAILKLFPLDTFVERPVSLMQTLDGSTPPIWTEYAKIVEAQERKLDFELIERFAFYEEAKKAYAIVSTGEKAIYANVILRKGIL